LLGPRRFGSAGDTPHPGRAVAPLIPRRPLPTGPGGRKEGLAPRAARASVRETPSGSGRGRHPRCPSRGRL